MRKSTIVNIFFLTLFILSFYLSEPYSKYLYYTALFALSGAITNEIAIFMLFNRVPFLYGSGIIEKNFDKFKASIKKMIMEQFFSKDRLDRFLELELENLNLEEIIDKTDFSPAFESLKESIMESKFGAVVNMFGGESALESLKVTFNNRLQSTIKSIVASDTFKMQLKNMANSHKSEKVVAKIDIIVTEKLNELSPKDVKSLIEKLIKEHLDWLVVWGAVFGALMGLISTLVYTL